MKIDFEPNYVKSRHLFGIMLLVVYCLTQLSGCGVVRDIGKSKDYDGPPKADIHISDIHDAVPKVEPFHPYGTRDYVLWGRQYKVLKSAKGYVKRGYASWYGSKFHGCETSTQERYNLYGMTAASPELPLPSYVEVTNLRNGKKVIVRVNDRGPFHPGRILDLSYAAAKKLDFVESGVAPVKIVAINPKEWSKKNSHIIASGKKLVAATTKAQVHESTGSSPLFLQVGAFADRENAERLINKINEFIDKPIKLKHNSDVYRVQIGPLTDAQQCDSLQNLLKQNGFSQTNVVSG